MHVGVLKIFNLAIQMHISQDFPQIFNGGPMPP